jgi:hypothetical protein
VSLLLLAGDLQNDDHIEQPLHAGNVLL